MLAYYPSFVGRSKSIVPPISSNTVVSAASGAEGANETALYAAVCPRVVAATQLVFGASGFLNHNSSVGSPTLQMRLRWGGLAGVELLLSPSLDPGSSVTNRYWSVEAVIGVRSVGLSGSVFVSGVLIGFTSSASLLQVRSWSSGGVSTGSSAVTVDTLTNPTLALTAKYSASASANNITIVNASLVEVS